MTTVEAAAPDRVEAQPLYARVRELLVQRLISGAWKPGQMIPSEFAIAGELGVSQGTVRKSLDEMTAAGLFVRRQGKGTFVTESEDKSILFRFFRLAQDEPETDDRQATFPTSRFLSQECKTASAREQKVLGLSPGSQVLVYERLRSDGSQPILWEQLVLPQNRFPGLETQTELPNNVYQLYSTRFGIMVAHVEEKLKAVIASDRVAQLLDIERGSALLQIDRRAFALDGSTVEWRVSQCRSDTMHYRNAL